MTSIIADLKLGGIVSEAICPQWAAKASNLELRFGQLWVALYPHYDLYVEQRLIPGRRFRFDFCHYPSRVAIEIQGYGPGHYSKFGVDKDNQKHRLAAENGWLVLPVESEKVECAEEHQRIASIIKNRIQAGKENGSFISPISMDKDPRLSDQCGANRQSDLMASVSSK